MPEISNIAVEIGVVVPTPMAGLQLWGRRENNLSGTTQTLLPNVQTVGRHPRLVLNAINTVINAGLLAPEVQIESG